MRRNNNNLWIETVDEFDRAAALVSVWLILKDNKVAGRITARARRSTKTYPAVHVAFIFYGAFTEGLPIYGHEKVTGLGFDLTNTAISDILNECREKLKEHCNIALNSVEWNVMNTWQKDFENAGYSVIRAL